MGAWIETMYSVYVIRVCGSPLAWGRGLKLSDNGCLAVELQSPLAWGRGLKRAKMTLTHKKTAVAPRVGAWIETATDKQRSDDKDSRPSRGGVD